MYLNSCIDVIKLPISVKCNSVNWIGNWVEAVGDILLGYFISCWVVFCNPAAGLVVEDSAPALSSITCDRTLGPLKENFRIFETGPYF